MKEALQEIAIEEKRIVNKEKPNIKDILWNYPTLLKRFFNRFIPFSYIFVFAIVGIFLLFILESNVIATIVEDSKSKDTFVEGSVGAISTFNPLFVSINYVDRAVQELVFDRFVYIDGEGEPTEGIAEEWTVSEDRLIYEFKIKDDIYWQDGTKLSMDDILFTFQTAKVLAEEYGFDSVGASLVGVNFEKIDKKTIRFTLEEPNPIFFEAVSLHIVPKSRLEDEDLSQLPFNMFARYPLGTGRYMVTRTEQNSVYLSDNKYDKYDANIKNIVLKVFPDGESLEMSFRIGVLDAVGGWDYDLMSFTKEYTNINKFEMTENYRTKLMFFNTRKDFFKEKDIRIGLNYLINREKFLKESNIGGVVRNSVFHSESWAFNSNLEYYEYNPEKAAEYFSNIGYEKNEESGYFENDEKEILSFTLSYFDNVTNDRLVTILQQMLKEEGVVLKLEKLNYNQITQEIIATRDFEVLLYEVETTIDPDQYNLWHSLKSNYPDLNISGYSYERVDILLEDARKTKDRTLRKEKYDQVQKYLIADAPALFLYNPRFFYFVKDSVSGIDLDSIEYSYQRFHNIEEWLLK